MEESLKCFVPGKRYKAVVEKAITCIKRHKNGRELTGADLEYAYTYCDKEFTVDDCELQVEIEDCVVLPEECVEVL